MCRLIVWSAIRGGDVAAFLEQLGQMHAVAWPPESVPTFLLLVAALEGEGGAVGVANHFVLPSLMMSLRRNSSQTVLVGVERVAALVDIGKLHRVADADFAGIGLFLAGQYAEQSRLAGAVSGRSRRRNAAGAELERQIVDQERVAEPPW